MMDVNLEIINVKIIKYGLLLLSLVLIFFLIKRYLTPKILKKLEAYKSIISTYLFAFIFLGGFYLSGKDGDIYFAALYPLYISIIIASVFSVKYRAQEIANVPEKYLLQELKWGTSIAVFTLILLILINAKQFFAKGIMFAFNLMFLGFLLNMSLIYKEYKKRHKIK